MTKRTLLLTPMTMVKSRRQEFLDEARLIPLGAPTMFVGKGGEGKSTLALDYVARVSTGTLDGRYQGEARNVVLITHEDDPATQLKPRLVAAGANLDLVHLIGVREIADGIESSDIPRLNRDMALIREAIETTAAVLVVLDPLTSTIDGNLDKVQDVRRALNPLAQLAQEFDLALVCIMHTRKGHSSLSDATSGSHAFRDVARALLLFAHDSESGNRIVTVDKASYSQNQGHSFAFALDSVEVATDDGSSTEVARVRNLGDSDVSVSDVWQRDYTDDQESTDAKSWLREYLEAAGGSVESSAVVRDALGEGYSKRTIQRARQSVAESIRDGFPAITRWTLKDSPSRATRATQSTSETTGTTGATSEEAA